MSFQWALQNAATSPSGYGAGAASKSVRTPERKQANRKIQQRTNRLGRGGGGRGGIRKAKARRNASWNIIVQSAQRTKREAATKAAKVKSRSTVTFKSKKRDVLIACIRAGKQNVAVRVKRNADGKYQKKKKEKDEKFRYIAA